MVKREQNSERLSEIYRKAADVFVEKGYHATPMSLIAKILGMSNANLYYYCYSKENLLYEIHLDYLKRHFIPILEEVEHLPDPEERIALFLRKFTLLTTSNRIARLLVHELPSLSKSHQNEIKLIWRMAYELIRDAIEELQLAGRASKFRGSFLTFLGVSMPFWTIYWFDYSRQVNSEELAETIVQTFLHGLVRSSK